MEEFRKPFNPMRRSPVVYFSLLLAVIAFCISIFTLSNASIYQNKERHLVTKNILTDIVKRNVLRVGYGGFPPYTIIDLNESDPNKKVRGFSVDLINEIAKQISPNMKVEWVQFSWETLKADLESQKFDIIADPVFQTIPRALDIDFCEPYSFFGIAVGLVKNSENRFKKFIDLNRSDIIISLAQGWTSTEYAKKVLDKVPENNFKEKSVTGDAVDQMNEVLLGRADIALNDIPSVVQYAKAHSKEVKALWIDNPPSRVAGSFALRKEDIELKNFFNNSIRILLCDGSIDRLDKKWKTFGYIPEYSFAKGAGLTN